MRRRILIYLSVAVLLAAAGKLYAQNVTWPAPGEVAVRSALDQSKIIHLIVVDTSATAPGVGTPVRAPMTSW